MQNKRQDEIKIIRQLTFIMKLFVPLTIVMLLFGLYHLWQYNYWLDYFGEIPVRLTDAAIFSAAIGNTIPLGSLLVLGIMALLYFFRYRPLANKYTRDEVWGSKPTKQNSSASKQSERLTDSLEQEIEKAQTMLNKGLIDEDEFKQIKARIISNM